MKWQSPNRDKLIRRAATYQRRSIIDEADFHNGVLKVDGSPEMQRRRNLEHLKYLGENKGVEYQIVESLTDDGYSGGSTRRPGYQRLLELIESKAIDTVITADLARLSRSIPDFLKFIEVCQEHEVDVIIPGMDLDTSNPYGEFVVMILMAMNSFERKISGHRQKANNLRRLLDEGRINGAGELLGFARDSKRKGHFLKDEAGAVSAEQVFRIYLKHTSRSATVEVVKAGGIKGPKDKKHPYGKEFTLGMLESMLFNVRWRYRGLWFLNLENKDKDPSTLPESKRYKEVDLKYGPILDLRLLDEVQERLDAEGTHKHKAGKDRYVYLLSPVLFYEDGRHFTGQGPKGGAYRYYWCENKERKFPDDCRIDCADLDKAIIARVKGFFYNNEQFAALLKSAIRVRQIELPKVEAEIRVVKEELKKIDQAEAALRQRLLDGACQDKSSLFSWLETEVEKLMSQREELKSKLELLERQRGDILNRSGLERFELKVREFVDRFDKLSRTEQRDLIRQIVTRIVVRRDNKIDLHIKWDPPAGVGVQVEEQILPLEENGRDSGIRTHDLLHPKQVR